MEALPMDILNFKKKSKKENNLKALVYAYRYASV